MASPRLAFARYCAIAEERGISWSGQRRAVLKSLWGAEVPRGAYDIAAALGTDGKPVHGASIYRALDAFEAAGIVVRIVSRRQFAISPDPQVCQWLALICTRCGACDLLAAEQEHARLIEIAGEHGFRARSATLELIGLCPGCLHEGDISLAAAL